MQSFLMFMKNSRNIVVIVFGQKHEIMGSWAQVVMMLRFFIAEILKFGWLNILFVAYMYAFDYVPSSPILSSLI